MVMMRDLRYAGWHTRASTFRIVAGPSVTNVGVDFITVSWTMSEVSTGQLEYGTTTAYGSTTTEQGISGGYSTHTQTIRNLDSGTTYNVRTKSTSASGLTVYSDNLTADTIGETTVEEAGPRDTPPLPQTYVVVPATVPTNGTDCSAQLQAFVDSVPNGTTIVFDKTETGSGGTEYRVSTGLTLRNRVGLTLWGYGAKIRQTRTDGSQAGSNILIRYGSEDIEVLGFELYGPNNPTSFYQLFTYLSGESSHGVAIWAARNVTVKDCTIHNTNGDGIYVSGNYTTEGDGDAGKGWTTIGPFDFSYNYLYQIGRQGITYNWGSGITMDWNLMEDIGAYPFDAEDTVAGSVVAINRVMSQVRVRHNVIRRWNWWTTYTARCVNLTHTTTEMQPIDYFEISNNLFDVGQMGYGRPSSGYGIPNGCYIISQSQEGGTSVRVLDLRIIDNTSTLDAELLNYTTPAYGSLVVNQHDFTLTGNDFQTLRFIHVTTTGTFTESGNDITLRTSIY